MVSGIKDEEIRETSLGSYEEDSFTLKDGYIEQKYIIGKYCKEIDAFRSTVVKIMCSKGGVEKITIYEENICNYVLILQTKDLCSHILYAEEINEESVKISCRPLLNDLDYKNHVNNNKMKFIHYLKNNKYDKWADKFNHLSDKDKKIIKQELIFKRRHFENTVLTLKSVDISKILTILQVYYDFIDDLNKYILMSPIENIFQTVFNMKFNSSSPILAQRKINIVAAQADRETQKLIKKINVKINYLIEFLDITFDMDKNFFYRKSAYERYSDMYKFYLDEIND
ncbi:hypothetical protein A3Q56_00405 [Intoshia linei]|uniref:Endoplasmic reticulum lectin 1 n=1 Tax=Intoshia linei TaxID=1819745 RepID=A0A177BC12_9BILA|nr:hypothetical protein A3Q56_00405 [Intoshia linei]